VSAPGSPIPEHARHRAPRTSVAAGGTVANGPRGVARRRSSRNAGRTTAGIGLGALVVLAIAAVGPVGAGEPAREVSFPAGGSLVLRGQIHQPSGAGPRTCSTARRVGRPPRPGGTPMRPALRRGGIHARGSSPSLAARLESERSRAGWRRWSNDGGRLCSADAGTVRRARGAHLAGTGAVDDRHPVIRIADLDLGSVASHAPCFAGLAPTAVRGTRQEEQKEHDSHKVASVQGGGWVTTKPDCP
jgi:hypothetical protein